MRDVMVDTDLASDVFVLRVYRSVANNMAPLGPLMYASGSAVPKWSKFTEPFPLVYYVNSMTPDHCMFVLPFLCRTAPHCHTLAKPVCVARRRVEAPVFCAGKPSARCALAAQWQKSSSHISHHCRRWLPLFFLVTFLCATNNN